jgi:hypothetical protein
MPQDGIPDACTSSLEEKSTKIRILEWMLRERKSEAGNPRNRHAMPDMEADMLPSKP